MWTLAFLVELHMGQVWRDDPQTVQRQRCRHGRSNTHDSSFPQRLHILFLLFTTGLLTNSREEHSRRSISSKLLPQHD